MNSPDQKGLQQFGCALTVFRIFASFVFPYIFVLGGAVALIFGARELQEARESEDWPVADGQVLSVKVQSHTSHHRGSSGARAARTSTSYSVKVEYEFEVDGARFTGDRLTIGQANFNRRKEAQAKAAEYPVGQPVKVHYDPEDPSRSCLETGIGTGVWILLGLGTVFFIVGTIMSIVLPRFFRNLSGRFARMAEMAAGAQQNDGRSDAV